MPSIDFDLFQSKVGLVEVAKALNLNVHRFNPLWRRSRCPICKHEDYRCLNVDWDKDTFYCHRCRRGGGPIQLACHILNVGPYEAVERICKLLGLDVPYRERVRTRRGPRRDASGEIIDDAEEDEV